MRKNRSYKQWGVYLCCIVMFLVLICYNTDSINAEENTQVQAMYRLYNPNSGEHFYTANIAERDNLISVGWNYEGVAWYAPTQGSPVYRLYNANAGDHHYTLSESERDSLVLAGWKYEGVAWYSGGEIPMYRAYNPNAISGSHHYTVSMAEIDSIVSVGWKYEGVSWYGYSNPSQPSAPAQGQSSSGNTTNNKKPSVSEKDFSIKEFEYEAYGAYYKYLIITNNSNTAVEVNGKATVYDADRNKEGIDSASINILGPGETSIMYFFFYDLEEFDHLEYELSYDTDTYYKPVVGNLEYHVTENKSNVIVDVTNVGNIPAQFVEAYVVFYDENNDIITVNSTYVTDTDYEIKPGATISEQVSVFDSFNHTEIYFTGRNYK